LDESRIPDSQIDGLLRADFNTPSAPPARIADHSPFVDDLDRIHEAYILGASSTTYTSIFHTDRNARHSGDVTADVIRQVWQHLPQAAAGAAVADCQ
jgi:hypothetical protein